MNASKLGMSLATVVLLAAAAVCQAQQAQSAGAQKAPQPADAAAASSMAGTTASTTGKAADPAAKNTPPAAKSSAAAPESAPGLSVALLKEARDDGFRPVTRHNVTLYCKSEIEVGSRFPIHTCYNEDRLKVVLQQYRAERMQLEQMHNGGMQAH